MFLETAANLNASRIYVKKIIFPQFVLLSEGTTKHLMIGTAGNRSSMFLNITLGFASSNIESLGETKLTVSFGAVSYKDWELPNSRISVGAIF